VIIDEIWLEKLRCEFMRIPRSFISDTCDRGEPFNKNGVSTAEMYLRLFVILSQLHLWSERGSCHLTDQQAIASSKQRNMSTSLSVSIVTYALRSSANNFDVAPCGMTAVISFMNTANSIGPSTLPCGTPLANLMELDIVLPIFTLWDLDVRNDFIHNNKVPVIPRFSNLNSNLGIDNLSKALAKSTFTTSVSLLTSSPAVQSCKDSIRLEQVDLLGKNPCWELERCLLANRNSRR
jgi:hypothetical protein